MRDAWSLNVNRWFIGQHERQSAVAALLRENFRGCADAEKEELTASRALERRQPRNIQHAQDQRDSGPRNDPLDDAADFVVVADCVCERAATNHPDKKYAYVVKLALREHHARQLRAIFVSQNRRSWLGNSRVFEQVHDCTASVRLRGPGAALARRRRFESAADL